MHVALGKVKSSRCKLCETNKLAFNFTEFHFHPLGAPSSYPSMILFKISWPKYKNEMFFFFSLTIDTSRWLLISETSVWVLLILIFIYYYINRWIAGIRVSPLFVFVTGRLPGLLSHSGLHPNLSSSLLMQLWD